MIDSTIAKNEAPMETSAWKEIVARYQKPSVGRAIWQIVNTLVPYCALWYLMWLTIHNSWSWTIPPWVWIP